MPQNEVNKFFEGLPGEDNQLADVFDDKPKEIEEKPKAPEELAPRKNRELRRLEEKLEAKDEMLNALNERVIELSENRRSDQEFAPGEVPAEWTALYGDTPEAKKAWQMQEILLNRATERARDEALEEFENRQQAAIEEQKGFERQIDSELEALEDEHDIDLTSNSPAARKARREFLELVQKLSPKDEEGTITGYADFGSTFEIYQETRTKEKASDTQNKQKELAARSMNKPENSQGGETSKITPGFRGWEKDYKI